MDTPSRGEDMTDTQPSSRPGPQTAIPLTPYLCVRDAAAAIGFYQRVFGAEEVYRLSEPGGRIGHAELRLGAARLMLSDEYPEHGVLGPLSVGGAPVSLHLEVADVDAVVARAVAAGAKLDRPVQDQFYGERTAKLVDPFGHLWHLGTHTEDVTPAEMQRRYDALLGQEGGGAPAPAPEPVPAAPKGFHTVTPYLQARQAEQLIDFVRQALGGIETFRTQGSAGGLHAEVRLGNSMLMIGGTPDMKWEEKPAALYVYVNDIDAAFRRAVEAGGIAKQEPADQSYGDRTAWVEDRFGNTWYLATHKGS
jgi:PhnB protein